MFVFLNSTLQVLQKISLLNIHFKETINISMDTILIISLFLLWVYGLPSITASTDYFISIKYFNLQHNMYIQANYGNPMFCKCVSHKRYGQFFGAHSWIFFFNSVGDTIFLNSIGKTSHIFDPKLDIVSEPYMTVLNLLPWSAVLFLRLQLLNFWENSSVNISGAMLFFTLNISYVRVWRWCIVTDLSIF